MALRNFEIFCAVYFLHCFCAGSGPWFLCDSGHHYLPFMANTTYSTVLQIHQHLFSSAAQQKNHKCHRQDYGRQEFQGFSYLELDQGFETFGKTG